MLRIPRAAPSRTDLPRVDPFSKQLGRREGRRLLPFERALNVQRHPAAELLIVDGNLVRARVESDSPADRAHSLGEVPRDQHLAIDAQLDLVVAAGKKFDRLRI